MPLADICYNRILHLFSPMRWSTAEGTHISLARQEMDCPRYIRSVLTQRARLKTISSLFKLIQDILLGPNLQFQRLLADGWLLWAWVLKMQWVFFPFRASISRSVVVTFKMSFARIWFIIGTTGSRPFYEGSNRYSFLAQKKNTCTESQKKGF